MAEGNAAIFDYAAIRKVLQGRGYRAIYHTAQTPEPKEALVCPELGVCRHVCSDEVANCRLRRLTP